MDGATVLRSDRRRFVGHSKGPVGILDSGAAAQLQLRAGPTSTQRGSTHKCGLDGPVERLVSTGRREEERASDGDRRNVHRGLASAARGTKASKATEPKDLREHTKEFYHTGDSYKCSLVKRGRHRLEQVLKNEFQVCPRQDATLKPSTAGLPTFKVTAQRLIEFVVEKLEDGAGDHPVDCEIYGGEARAIVAAEQDVEDPKSRPTDLDLRFKIGDKSFERCRDIVEEFLVKQLSDLTPGADRSLIRQCYFQKQVVIGSDFRTH